MTCLTLFAGGGGADVGLRDAGVHHAACIDADPTCVATLRAAGFPGVQGWIGQMDLSMYAGVDLMFCSPPCQPYSRAGQRLGAADPRDGWPATLDAIRVVRPKWVIIENVVGAPATEWCAALSALYPCVSSAVLDAADWGLPSHRRRVYVVAGSVGYRWPSPTHYGPEVPWLLRGDRRPWVGFGEALGLVCRADPDRGAGMVARHGPRRGYAPDEPIGCIRGEGQGGYVLTPGNGGHKPAPRLMDLPAHSITASCPQYLSLPSAGVTTTEVKGTRASAASGYAFHGGPDRASDSLFLATGRRRLTWQECAKLVGLPDGYPLQGTIEAKYRQVGNAVAPVMAKTLADSML